MNNDKITQRRIRRLVKVLHSHSLYTRQQVLETFDARADFASLRGVGPVLAKTLAALLQLSDEEYAVVTGMSNNGQGRSLLAPPQEVSGE